MTRYSKVSLLCVSVAAVAACSATLLWQARYQEHAPKIASALATDADNNVYVGGGTRNADKIYDVQSPFAGLLLKYDANGVLQWESASLADGAVVDVEVVSPTVLAVAVGSPPGANIPDSFWLVSATDGQVIKKVADIGDGSEAEHFQLLKVIGDHIYLVSGTLSYSYWYIPDESTPIQSTVEVFDPLGNSVQRRTVEDGEVMSIDGLNESNVAVLVDTIDGMDVEVWQEDLQAVWSHRIADFMPMIVGEKSLLATVQGVHAIVGDQVAKWSWSGEQVFSSSLGGYFEQYAQDPNGLFVSETPGWDGGYLTIDTAGDLLIASSVMEAFSSGMIGDFDIQTLFSADTLVAKLDGESGAVEWATNLDLSSLAEDDKSMLKMSTYSPMGINTVGDKVLLTLRGITASYSSCEYSEFFLLLNPCHLNSIDDHFGKTMALQSADGTPAPDRRHEVPYPRKVTLNSAGQLIVVGDEEHALIASWQDYFSIGWNVNSYKSLVAESSDIITEVVKY